ncbi:hypothetical protein K435DRAFT_810455 [Dendrothele bispora CBS 962.96]|uniref:Uncharacterized protein n=1 Tax=Dendrothele bispora (strain CBS 962.96) TaxID=1314807 RepID=A0A4S8KVB9_DENBC|nr:hypothetical protein K435DRAFT_810455 [Dendrothele bispora CBS 962.96]
MWFLVYIMGQVIDYFISYVLATVDERIAQHFSIITSRANSRIGGNARYQKKIECLGDPSLNIGSKNHQKIDFLTVKIYIIQYEESNMAGWCMDELKELDVRIYEVDRWLMFMNDAWGKS